MAVKKLSQIKVIKLIISSSFCIKGRQCTVIRGGKTDKSSEVGRRGGGFGCRGNNYRHV